MNAKIVFAFLLVAVAVCCAVQAEKLPEMPSMSQGMQTLKGINMSKIQDQMKGMQGEMGKFDATKMNQYFKDMYTKMTAAAKANKLPTGE